MRPIDADALKEHIESFVVGGAKAIEETTCGNEWIDGIHTAYREIGNMPTIDSFGSWIPCAERLPEEHHLYLTTIKKANGITLTTHSYFFTKEVGWSDACVIAWMPLPEPYGVERVK